jgi:hypothetical protein
VAEDEVAHRLQQARGVVEDLAVHPRHLDLLGGVRLAWVLVGLQRPLHGDQVREVDAAQGLSEEVPSSIDIPAP